jgi:hypothetical protein
MAISYNTGLLDRYIAPGISTLTLCGAPDITSAHPEAPHWMANHFLNSAFRGTFKNKFRQYAVNQILRAQVAFADYHEARDLSYAILRRVRRTIRPAARTSVLLLDGSLAC